MRIPANPLQVADREEWRAWLQDNHAVEKEAWLIILKKHATGPGVGYEEALEEALCFGWIDGVMRSVDDEIFTLRFSPRKAQSIWSESNKRRVERLIEKGQMTEAGLAKIQEAKANGEWDKAAEREDTSILPSDLDEALQRDGQIWFKWESLAPSRKKQYIYWITSAKREETRQRRIRETVAMVEESGRPPASWPDP
jgi:uncharacterized protein YdeI (YjbR/CyaY-like superfamily)